MHPAHILSVTLLSKVLALIPAGGELLRRAREENQVILELLRGYRFRS